MEKKQRMFYFGTNGCAGHYALPINSDLPDVKSDDWARFDGAMLIWIRKYGTYSQAKLFGSEWSVYAVPRSVDDARDGCHTDSLWEGTHSKEEMEAYIKQDAFLRRQFCFKLEANMVNRGDIVHASDDTLIKFITLAQKEKFITRPMQTMLVDDYKMNRTLVITDS
jgi:hypothetical protein